MKRSGSPEIVVLHCPPATLDYPPHSPALLGTILKKAGLKVRVIDFNLIAHGIVGRGDHPLWHKINRAQWHDPDVIKPFFEKNKQYFYKILQGICKFKPEAIFIYLDYPNEIIAALVAGLIKEVSADQVVMAGGPGGFLPEQQQLINRWSAGVIDRFVSGSSEASCAMNILAALSDVSGDETGDQGKPIDVFPTYEGFRTGDYTYRMRAVSWATGCAEKCIFCPLKIETREYICRSIDSILDEIDYLLEHKISDFWVKGSPVNGDPEFLAELARRIVDSGRTIFWAARVLPVASLTNELLELLKRAGCHTLVFCVVSGSGGLRRSMGCSPDISVVEQVLRSATEAGLKTSVELISGLPGEFFEEFAETKDFLQRNVAAIKHLRSASPLVLVPGTSLFDNAESEFRLIIPENDPCHNWMSWDGNSLQVRRNRMRDLFILAGSLKVELGHVVATRFIPSVWPLKRFWHYKMYNLNRGFEPWEAYVKSKLLVFMRNVVQRWLPSISYVQEQDIQVIKGILDGEKAFVGPEVVHLDITNLCNMNCLACWDRSPLVFGQNMKADYLKRSIPYADIKALIDDLAALGGMRQLKLSGGGEPTCHPDFKEILKYIRGRNKYAEIDINTNFSMVDDEICQLMIELEINLLTVSLWAATPETYHATHPNQSQESFKKIIDKLRTLVAIRKHGLPKIFIHNVLMKQNFHEVEKMLALALDLGADEVHFTLVDPVPGKTEDLLLNLSEQDELLEMLKEIRKNVDDFNIYRDDQAGHKIKITNFLEFYEKLSSPEVTKGVYDRKALQKMPCYMGWQYTRIMADGRVVPCCKGHKLPMGNILKERFCNIWTGTSYREFRWKGKTLPKTDHYFSIMSDNQGIRGCSNCDNILHNKVIHDKYLYCNNYLEWMKVQAAKWSQSFIKRVL